MYPPPYTALQQPTPYYHSGYKKRSGGGSCCKFLYCICCCILLAFLIVAILSTYVFIIYDPKLPSYNIDGIEVKAFDIQPDNNTLNTELVITVYDENPNKKIGFDYIKGSWMDVKYSDINICGGDLPEFEQDNKNTTHMHVYLKGKTDFGSGLQQSLAENRKNQKIPLVVKLNVLVSVVLGKLPLRSFRVSIACNIIVDNLDPNKQINIISRETEVHFLRGFGFL